MRLRRRDAVSIKTTPRCILCGREYGIEQHHVKSRARGGSNHRRNLADLCGLCHQWVTHHPKEAHKLGLMRHSWEPE